MSRLTEIEERLAWNLREGGEGVGDSEYAPHFQDEYRRLWHEAAANRDELRSLLIELARWSRVAELNADLHARIASALALADEEELIRRVHRALSDLATLLAEQDDELAEAAKIVKRLRQRNAERDVRIEKLERCVPDPGEEAKGDWRNLIDTHG